jgi:hypothetical protein
MQKLLQTLTDMYMQNVTVDNGEGLIELVSFYFSPAFSQLAAKPCVMTRA